MSSNQDRPETYEVRCPKCKAAVGQRCRYMKGGSQRRSEWNPVIRQTEYYWVLHAEGDETRVAHLERRYAYANRERVARAKEQRRWTSLENKRLTEVAYAQHEWEMREHLALRGWLKQHGARLFYTPAEQRSMPRWPRWIR